MKVQNFYSSYEMIAYRLLNVGKIINALISLRFRFHMFYGHRITVLAKN